MPGTEGIEDALYGENAPLWRKVSGNTRVTVFDGGHEIVHLAALNWLANQKKGAPAVWKVEKVSDLPGAERSSDSGK